VHEGAVPQWNALLELAAVAPANAGAPGEPDVVREEGLKSGSSSHVAVPKAFGAAALFPAPRCGSPEERPLEPEAQPRGWTIQRTATNKEKS
jgi:hypothetical protein